MDEFKEGLEDAWSATAAFVPKLVGFLAVLLVGYLVAKILERVLDKVLERVGFDNWVERGGVKQALARSRYDASSLLAKVVFYVVFLFVLQLAFGIFGTNPISDLLAGVIAYLPNVFVAIVIIVVASAVAAAVKEVVEASIGGLSYGRPLAIGSSVVVIALGIFAALNQLRIAPAIVNGVFYALLATIVGSAIVAIGGGGIGTMQQYWQRAAGRLEEESNRVRQEAEGATERVKERAQTRKDQAKKQTSGGGSEGKKQTAGGGSSRGRGSGGTRSSTE